MKSKIFISASTFAKHGREPLELLEKAGLTYYLNSLNRRLVQDELIEMGKGCEGTISGLELFDARVLERLSDLKCISRVGVGIDNIDLVKAKEKGVVVFNTPDVVIQPVAELAVAMALDLLKKLSVQTALLKAGQWEKKTGNLMAGKKVGILGLGRIGRRTAELMKALGALVYGSDVAPDMNWAYRVGVKVVSIEELLRSSDIVSIHFSYRQDALFILGEKEIASMKKGALLINVARGKFIDEAALYEALNSGHLSGAGLDVYCQEPYQGKLCELENIVLTPHIATLTEETRLEMEVQAAKNLINFFKNKGTGADA